MTRRLATQSLSRVRSDLANEQERAQIALGPVSERGGKKLLRLSTSLAGLDVEQTSMHGSLHAMGNTAPARLQLSSSVPALPPVGGGPRAGSRQWEQEEEEDHTGAGAAEADEDVVASVARDAVDDAVARDAGVRGAVVDEDAAARTMQKVARGRNVRKEQQAQREAAIAVQKVTRGRLARRPGGAP